MANTHEIVAGERRWQYFFVAWRARIELRSKQEHIAKSMKRTTSADGIKRASGRIDVCEPDAWMTHNTVRKGRSWLSAAPRSPADHWLACQGYQQFPF
jgi:hypothetical protein